MTRKHWIVGLATAFVLVLIWETAGQAQERSWQIILDRIFREGTKPLYLYARERDGQWISVVGSSRDPDRDGGKTYNRSWYCGDLSDVPIRDGEIKGRFTLHVTPDFWVPRDHKPYDMVFEIDAELLGSDELEGTYRIVSAGSTDESVQGFGRAGRLKGTAKPHVQPELPAQVTLECNMHSSLVGGDPAYGQRCMVLWLGMENGRLTSTIQGRLSRKYEHYGRKPFHSTDNRVSADRDGFSAHIVVPATTLDMEPCRYVFDIEGHVLEEVLVGTYRLTVEIDGKPDVTLHGSFDGKWYEGVTHLEIDARPWYKSVKGFEPPGAGEHPRLLFRESDLPALQKKARTPEGQAILRRLRFLLDGENGETMTDVFSTATHAYMGGGHKNTVVNEPGVYTFGHAAGYGLLYQLTGNEKYAEFGRQCFEKALAGVRDRDDRYSFRSPGGALRAGPTLGWYAVGYDLCYDGWDQGTRERFGRAIAEYSEGEKGKQIDLEALARGTMPPSSNHFGMQIGGASLALLAITGEPWVDQERIDTLMRIAEQSVIRNVSEGFGDGGFFAEGDGTGSMASQIAYLSALKAWRNARGKDFVNVERPNVRMLTLKWIYQTVFRDGRPVFWPIRGSYGHNVWSREGISGAGYFAIGIGAVSAEQKAALKGYYNRFLLDRDREAGTPYDTASRYPHLAVCAFVNWPVDIDPRNPAEVLPLCYRDTSCGFYAWRNRWRDANDTVITVLTSRTEGYMGAKPDKALMLNTRGERIRWGTVTEGPTRYWSTSPQGRSSSLALADGTCFAVDFTGAAGADIMLVTTGKAEGEAVRLGDTTLTFYFPNAERVPDVSIEGDAAVVGGQKVRVVNGNLEFVVKGK